MPGRVANLRPGLIIGPGDPTGRFTHWPSRMAEGGEVLCPGDGTTPVQYIDGRDLGAWIVKVVEDGTVGIVQRARPRAAITMKEVLEACNAAAGGKATLTWVGAAFLEQQDVSSWTELPLWFDAKGEMAGFGTRSNARAVAAGLKFRPILDTARDTLAWLPDRARGPAQEARRERHQPRERGQGPRGLEGAVAPAQALAPLASVGPVEADRRAGAAQGTAARRRSAPSGAGSQPCRARSGAGRAWRSPVGSAARPARNAR